MFGVLTFKRLDLAWYSLVWLIQTLGQPASQEVREGGKERQKGQSLSPQHRGPGGITWHPVCHRAINKYIKRALNKNKSTLG